MRGQLSNLLRTLRQNAVKGKLKPSKTVYVSWGKGCKQRLRFSKSGHPRIEEAYATHFVKRDKSLKDKPSHVIPADRREADAVNVEPEKLTSRQSSTDWPVTDVTRILSAIE
jgi:hypothetical protein